MAIQMFILPVVFSSPVSRQVSVRISGVSLIPASHLDNRSNETFIRTQRCSCFNGTRIASFALWSLLRRSISDSDMRKYTGSSVYNLSDTNNSLVSLETNTAFYDRRLRNTSDLYVLLMVFLQTTDFAPASLLFQSSVLCGAVVGIDELPDAQISKSTSWNARHG